MRDCGKENEEDERKRERERKRKRKRQRQRQRPRQRNRKREKERNNGDPSFSPPFCCSAIFFSALRLVWCLALAPLITQRVIFTIWFTVNGLITISSVTQSFFLVMRECENRGKE